MRKYSLLVIEDKSYYDHLLDFDSELFHVEYSGLRHYKSDLRKFDLIISFNYLSDLGNYIIVKAKIQNVRTLLLSDGIIEWSNMFSNSKFTKKNLKLFHPIIHDYFFCVGSNESSYFNSLGQKTYNYIPNRMKTKETKSTNAKKIDFLLTTANTPYHNLSEKRILIKILKNILQDMKKNEYSFAFRIYDRSLIEELNILEHQNFIKNDFNTTFNQFKCLITTPSSIIISAIKQKKPVAQIIYRDTPLFLQSGWMITSLNVDSTIKSMLNHEVERMDFQLWQLNSYINESGDVSKIISRDKEKTNVSEHFNTRLENLIQSKYNINFEYLVRRLFLKFKRK